MVNFEKSNVQRNRTIFSKIVTQIHLEIRGKEIFREVQKRVLRWGLSKERNLRNVDENAWKGESFSTEGQYDSEQAEAIKLLDSPYWAFKLTERFKDHSRIWTTEVGLANLSDESVVLGVRLICAQNSTEGPIPRSIPNFVRGIVFTQQAYLDRRPVSAEPWQVSTEEDVKELVSFLENPSRLHPVVVFSTEENSEDHNNTILDVKKFIRRTAGYVHTVTITSSATYYLTECLGKEFSVFRQAVRTYYPNFDSSNSFPTDHPVATKIKISSWDNDNLPFEDFLIGQSLRITQSYKILEKKQPSFHHIKRIKAEEKNKSKAGSGNEDLLILLQEENNTLKQDLELIQDMAANAEEERDKAISDFNYIKSNYLSLQYRLDLILKNKKQKEENLPRNFDNIGEWARENMSGYVEIHPRAIKSVQKSIFEDVGLIYKALLLLRDFYVPMRREGGLEMRKDFDKKLKELGLENSKCFLQKNKAKNFGGDYYVDYQGERRELDWHLKGNSGRDQRRSFRVYYFWDDDTQRVIIGHMPNHLQNDLT